MIQWVVGNVVTFLESDRLSNANSRRLGYPEFSDVSFRTGAFSNNLSHGLCRGAKIYVLGELILLEVDQTAGLQVDFLFFQNVDQLHLFLDQCQKFSLLLLQDLQHKIKEKRFSG